MKGYDKLEPVEKTMALQIFNELLQNEQQKAAQAVTNFQTEHFFWRHFHHCTY